MGDVTNVSLVSLPLSWGIELEANDQAEVSSSFFQENLRPRASKIHYIRKENQGVLLMPPQIVIKYKSGVTMVVTCRPPADVQKHLDYFNGRREVHKAYVKP